MVKFEDIYIFIHREVTGEITPKEASFWPSLAMSTLHRIVAPLKNMGKEASSKKSETKLIRRRTIRAQWQGWLYCTLCRDHHQATC